MQIIKTEKDFYFFDKVETVWPWPPCSIEVHEATQIGQLGLIQEAASHQINYQSHSNIGNMIFLP